MDDLSRNNCRQRAGWIDPRSEWVRISHFSLVVQLAVLLGAVFYFAVPLSRTVFQAFSARIAAESWREVPAYISSVGLSGDKGDDTVHALYRYKIDGEWIFGDEVALPLVCTNVYASELWGERFERLERHVADETPFRCFVDSEDPRRSLLYRDGGLGPLSALVGWLGFLLVVGILGVVYTATYFRRKASYAASADRNPDAPWRWNPKWAGETIRPAARPLHRLIAAVVACTAASGWFVYTQWLIATTSHPDDRLNVLSMGVLPWLFLAYPAFRRFHHWRYHTRTTHLRLDPMPAEPGGILKGTIETSIRLPSGVRLAAVLCRVHGRGWFSAVRSSPDWEAYAELPERTLEPGAAVQSIPVRFQIPAEEPCTDERRGVAWVLELHSITPECGWWVSFEVPVFGAGESGLE